MKTKVFVFIAFLGTAGGFWLLDAGAQTTSNTNRAANVDQSRKVAAKPEIVSRKDWGAKSPVGDAKTHEISIITIHHTATAQKKENSLEKKLVGLQRFSQTESKLSSGKLKPVWFDIPYHFYIAVDGRIGEGREMKYVGDTNTEYDPTGHALIVVEGNFETEKPSAEQIESLKKLTAWLASEHNVASDKIKAHNDFASTACPGKNLKSLLLGLQKMPDQKR